MRPAASTCPRIACSRHGRSSSIRLLIGGPGAGPPRRCRGHEPSAGSPRLMTGNVFGERVMNNFSLLAANRLTHLKMVAVALVLATLGIGFAARVTEGSGTANWQAGYRIGG